MTSTETKMQTAHVMYCNGEEKPKPVRIPMPPPEKLAAAFASGKSLYLHVPHAGLKYGWHEDGTVEMYDSTWEIQYEWYHKPTLEETIHESRYNQSMTTIFKTDGTVIRRVRPYPYTRPNDIWEFVWPPNPETILVDGDDDMYTTQWDGYDEWADYVTERDDCMSECSKCSSGPKMPGYCEHFYEDTDDDDKQDDEYHEHPYYDKHWVRHYNKCWVKDCVPCPGCGGPYDGMDHGGLGCTRDCAWGDLMDQ